MKMKDIKQELDKYYVIVDPYVIDIILGTIVANLIIPRDPCWLMLVAASSGGKSSLMAPCAGVPSVHFIDDLTEKTFLSGYKAGKKEVSLLKTIGNGVMCFSDFTTIISKNPMTKGEILSQFRLIYDGHFSKRTGTGEITWDGKMGFLGASTPDVYFQLEESRSMGERFLYYTIKQPSDQEIVDKQESVKMSSKEIGLELRPFYRDYMNSVKDFALAHNLPELKMNAHQRARIDRSAIFCVRGKASVHLDYKSGKPDAIPNRPGVGRDRKMFETMLHALQLMNCYEKNDATLGVENWMVEIIDRAAWSSISRERRKILEILTSTSQALTASQIGATGNFGLQKEAVEKYMAPLFAVGIVKKEILGNAHRWTIEDKDTISFVKSVADETLGEEDIAENTETISDNDEFSFDNHGD